MWHARPQMVKGEQVDVAELASKTVRGDCLSCLLAAGGSVPACSQVPKQSDSAKYIVFGNTLPQTQVAAWRGYPKGLPAKSVT